MPFRVKGRRMKKFADRIREMTFRGSMRTDREEIIRAKSLIRFLAGQGKHTYTAINPSAQFCDYFREQGFELEEDDISGLKIVDVKW